MRNLQDALKRAENLRDFRKTNELSFENTSDYQDIVNLADELERFRSYHERDQKPCPTCGHEPLFYQYD